LRSKKDGMEQTLRFLRGWSKLIFSPDIDDVVGEDDKLKSYPGWSSCRRLCVITSESDLHVTGLMSTCSKQEIPKTVYDVTWN